MQTGWYARKAVADLDTMFSYSPDFSAGEKYYYFDPKTGAAKTGWQTVPVPAVRDGELVVAQSDGCIGTGSAKAKLYFKEDGSLARNEDLVIGKKLYHFGPDGQLADKETWADPGREGGYRLPNGTKLTGRKAVSGEGKTYYFDTVTGAVEKNVLRKTGRKWYYYDNDGVETVTLPALFDSNGNKVTVSFASDGSVKGFLVNGTAAKNTSIIDADGGVLAVLNAKGQPMTGIVRASFTDPVTGDAASALLYLDADGGRHEYAVSASADPDAHSLVKIGGKYYVYAGGEIRTRSEIEADGGYVFVEVDSYDTLSAADRKALREYERLARANGEHMIVCVGADGAVVTSRTVTFRGFTCRLNRFGIPLETSGAVFFKWGKNWYSPLLADGQGGAETGELYAFSADGRISTPVTISYTGDGQLLGLTDPATGKPLSGTFLFPGSPDFLTCLKNGLPTTGDRKVSLYGANINVFIDREIGGAIVSDD